MYYVYSHTRLDNNEIFYIGTSKRASEERMQSSGGFTHKGMYYRAYEKMHSRTDNWKEIVNAYGYSVSIVQEFDTKEEALAKEIELIALYRNTVVNITDGGLGVSGFVPTEDHRQRTSKSMSGRKLTEEHIINSNKRKYKAVRMLNLSGQYLRSFPSLQEAGIYVGEINYPKSISNCVRGKRVSAYGFKWEYESKETMNKES